MAEEEAPAAVVPDAQAASDSDNAEDKIKQKRAELRAKMEEASKARRAKKGFMTPDRKKKLRLLLRKKAAEELKKEEERKASERKFIIAERCGIPEDLELFLDEDSLKQVCQEYWTRAVQLSGENWDLERNFMLQAYQIQELNTQVSDLRGRFQKPILKKVSKYDNKFAKLQKKAAEFTVKNQLKVVKKPDYQMKDEDKKKKESEEGEEGKEPAAEEAAKEGEVEPPAEGAESAPVPAEGEVPPEGAPAEGEQPGAEGEPPAEEPPAEPEQPAEPPPPPEPEHTEEELWQYIKEAVTSACPLSIDELVKKMIECVQAVPQGYLKPVVEASIRRTQSLDLGGLALGEAPKEGQTAPGAETAPPPAEGAAAPPPDSAAAPEDPAGETLAPPADAAPAAEVAPAADVYPAADVAPAADGAPAPPADAAQAPAAEAVSAEEAAPTPAPADPAAPPAEAAAEPPPAE